MGTASYPGLYVALSDLRTAVFVSAVALSAAPEGPADWSSIESLLLPYPPMMGVWWGAGLRVLQPGAVVIQAELTFQHPDGVGPLSCGAVAFVYPTDPPTLLDVVSVSPAKGTAGPGEVLSVNVLLVSVAPGGGN